MKKWIFALALSACYPQPVNPVPDYFDAELCNQACDHGKVLECDFAEPTPNGVECSQVCIETELTGWSRWHPECVLKASTCEEANRLSADGC